MPVNTDISVPFLPQTSTTHEILAGIQLANEQHAQRQQLALEAQGQPSQIAERLATAKRLESQTQLEQLQLQMKKDLFGVLTGSTPGSVPAQAAPAAPAPGMVGTGPGVAGAPVSGGAAAIGPGQTEPSPKDFASNTDSFRALVEYQNKKAPGLVPGGVPAAPAPAAPKENPSGLGGLIGQTVNNLLSDPNLKPQERAALVTAGRQSLFKTFNDPSTALDGVVSTYNDILRMHGEMERTIHTETVPDSQSSTGYSQVATHADGTEAYRHVAPPPIPKNLEEASSYLGLAAFNYNREPTDGNKSALALAKTQHDLAYQDRLDEAARTARATAQARGTDYEAMIRTGVNPITKEKLTINNAPPGALVNPTTGQPIPQDMINIYKPTQNERQTADTARQVLAISQDLKNEITKNPNLIGPLAGRSQQALQSLGFSKENASKLIDDVTFLQSAATKMHTGRFSNAILEKMSSVIKPGMNKDEFQGALNSVNDVAGRYANEDKLTTVYEFQQRQQFENQGQNPFVPGQFSAGNPFAQPTPPQK